MGNDIKGSDPTVKACGSTELIKMLQDLVFYLLYDSHCTEGKMLVSEIFRPPSTHTHTAPLHFLQHCHLATLLLIVCQFD